MSAGLIAAVGLKLISVLRSNPMGMGVCWLLAALTFAAIALLRLPLAWVLLGVGGAACAYAYRTLQAVERRANKAQQP